MTNIPVRTIHQARAHIVQELLHRGKTLDEVLEWDFDLTEDGKTILIIASFEDGHAVAGFDWPRGDLFDPWQVRYQFFRWW
jgi:hypothetical protein